MNIAFKRFFSYLVDMFIIFIVITVFKQFFTNKYEIKLNMLNEDYFMEKISIEEYNKQSRELIHKIDKENITINIINTVMILIIFILVPYVNNGQTLGQKLFKIKIFKDTKLELNDLIGRAVVINGLGYMLFMFIILYITNDNLYFYLINIIGFLQILVAIINCFMVLYSKDKCGIADIFTKTRIEELK